MPVSKYRLFYVVSFANVKNIGSLNVYQYSRFMQFSKIVGCVSRTSRRVVMEITTPNFEFPKFSSLKRSCPEPDKYPKNFDIPL